MADLYQGPEEQDEPDASKESPAPEPEQEDSKTLFLPESSLGGKKCEPGDVISMKVVGKTADGELELAVDEKKTDKVYGDPDEEDAKELRQALSARPMPA